MGSTSTDPIVGTIARVWMIGAGAWHRQWERHNGLSPIDPDTGALTPTAALWARALADFPREHVLATLERFIRTGSVYAPNLPEVRRACFGIPSLAEVRCDLGRKSLPFTLLVWERLDGWAFGHADQYRANAMLLDAYDWAIEQRMLGATLPALPAPESKTETPNPQPISEAETEAWKARIRKLLHSSAGETSADDTAIHNDEQGGTHDD